MSGHPMHTKQMECQPRVINGQGSATRVTNELARTWSQNKCSKRSFLTLGNKSMSFVGSHLMTISTLDVTKKLVYVSLCSAR